MAMSYSGRRIEKNNMIVFLTLCLVVISIPLCTYFLLRFSKKSNMKKIKCGNKLFHITITFTTKHKTKKE